IIMSDHEEQNAVNEEQNNKEEQQENNKEDSEDKSEDGKDKRKEYFKEELRRLQESLEREAEKIVPPEEKEYTPYIFNTLEPYYNTKTAKFIVELPEGQRHDYAMRETSIGLCDPWEDLKMDKTVGEHIEPKPFRKDEKSPRDNKERPPKEGSTRLPKYPAVAMDTKEISNKKLNYADVPEIREEIKVKFGRNADQKVNADYTRTKQDFFRMELDKMEEVAPSSRPNMRKAYFAYLQNTPGSKKAIHECMKELDTKDDENEDNKSEKNSAPNSARSKKSSTDSARGSKSDKKSAPNSARSNKSEQSQKA
ncbi:unnamed protein product, partial [Owenia fusiformis]